ncbi:MAG: NAD(P)/FAD-dependent oxidoreductase [Patescibacteria group bacterium]
MISSGNDKKEKYAIIIGAGPAGLSAAYELLAKTDIKPIIIERDSQVGGISKTINYKGWRFDVGPHRFFTKSPVVSALWERILPKAKGEFLDVKRLTRIHYQDNFFDYPIKLSVKNLKKLGLKKIERIISGYISVRLKPIKPEISLEDFFINRFGRELYLTFFKSYTEKIWGEDCAQIPKSWGAQRIKNLSIKKIITEYFKKSFRFNYHSRETSLIDNFSYPKLGAGEMYERMADIITERGGQIILNSDVLALKVEGGKLISVNAWNPLTQEISNYSGDYYFSTQALQDLIAKTEAAPMEIKKIASGLVYRNLILVALIYNKLNISSGPNKKNSSPLISDNWIYIHDEGVKIGRLDIFNNFSPALLKEGDKILLGAEFFCNADDELWSANDESLINLARVELEKIGIASSTDFYDGTVYRQAQAYPAYFGTYNRFPELRNYLDSISNLYLIGRNGQHRYNNMDHSILSALTAVDNIARGQIDKSNIWAVNTEDDYHE